MAVFSLGWIRRPNSSATVVTVGRTKMALANEGSDVRTRANVPNFVILRWISPVLTSDDLIFSVAVEGREKDTGLSAALASAPRPLASVLSDLSLHRLPTRHVAL
jgi:hypothetical protein